jgi:intein/homing endonuclease
MFDWECVHPKTLILTKSGLWTIEELLDKKEIEVMTVKDGGEVCFRRARVYRAGPHDKVYALKPQGLRNVIVSENHPIYVRFARWGKKAVTHPRLRDVELIESETSKTRVRIVGRPQWMTVGEVKKILDQYRNLKAFVYMPLNYTVNGYSLTDDELFILGLFMAEGSFVNEYNGLRFTFGLDEMGLAERLCSAIERYVGELVHPRVRKDPRPGYPNCIVVELSSKKLKELIVNNVVGRYSHERCFDVKVMFMDPELQMKLVDAMVLGDGHVYRGGYTDYTTASAKLAFQVAYMLLRNRIVPSMRSGPQKTEWGKHEVWHVRWTRRKKTVGAFFDSGGVWLMIRGLEEVECKEDLYNMEVEETENYVTEAGVVHNCAHCDFHPICARIGGGK